MWNGSPVSELVTPRISAGILRSGRHNEVNSCSKGLACPTTGDSSLPRDVLRVDFQPASRPVSNQTALSRVGNVIGLKDWTELPNKAPDNIGESKSTWEKRSRRSSTLLRGGSTGANPHCAPDGGGRASMSAATKEAAPREPTETP